MRRSAWWDVAFAAVAVALGCAVARGAEPPRTPTPATDVVLGPDTWQQAVGLLPDEFLAAYRRGDYRHRIARYNLDLFGDDPVFRAAIEANEGRYDLDADGTIVDKTTGKPPDYVYAWPFPKIDPADPKAAMKIVWNYFYTLYYGGNAHYRADLVWLGRKGIDRTIAVDAEMKHYDGQHPRFRERENPLDLLTQSLAKVLSPADVSGIVSLSWRYRDADKRDSIWTYVPVLRRVRQVSPADRSDGFLGSDMTQDDGPFFDGKVQDFTWKLVGQKDLLVPFDRLSFEEDAKLQRLPSGGWRMIIPDRPRLGAEAAGLEGGAMVSDRGGVDSPAGLGGRGRTEGSLLPFRQTGPALRPRYVHGKLRLEVRLERRFDQLLHGDQQQHRQSRSRRAVGVGRRCRRRRHRLEARSRHDRRHHPRPLRTRRLPHPDQPERVLAPASHGLRPLRLGALIVRPDRDPPVVPPWQGGTGWRSHPRGVSDRLAAIDRRGSGSVSSRRRR